MIELLRQGDVALITMGNGRLNILTRAMHRRLFEVLQAFSRDDTLKVAVLTCEPGSSFSAGDDLNELGQPLGDEPDWEALVMQMHRRKPVVAAVRGHCLAQGLAYLLQLTDIRFATPDASFGFPEIRFGMGGAGVVARLAQQIPQTVAMRMTLTGMPLTAQQALECHLINEIAADDALLEVALAEAGRIARHPLQALCVEMTAIARNDQVSRSEALALLDLMWRPSSLPGKDA